MPPLETTITRSFDRAVGASRGRVGDIVLSAIVTLRAGITQEAIDAALASRSAVPIFQLPAWRRFENDLLRIFSSRRDGPLWPTIERAARAAARSPINRRAIEFEPVFDRAAQWLDQYGAQLVTNVTDNTRQGVADVISAAFDRSQSRAQAARALLDVRGLGLIRRDERALIKLGASLIEGGMSPERLALTLARRYQLMRRRRSRVIAKTETMGAASEAQTQLWAEAVAQGQLDADLFELEWVTRRKNACPRCLALDGTRRPIRGNAFVGRSVVGHGRFNGVQEHHRRPTVHPNCNCVLRVVTKRRTVIRIGRT